MILLIFLIALCTGFAVESTISFGNKAASIVIEDGSTLQVNGDVYLTGTVVNDGILSVADGVSFDISQGIYIDHGGLKRIFNEDTTIHTDIALSSLNTLTISSFEEEGGTIIVTGTGQKITFSDSGINQLIIGDNTTVVFRCIELVGYFDGAISLGEGSVVQFAASTISLTKDALDFTPLFYFVVHPDMPETPSYLRGNGHSLALTDGVLYVELDTLVTFDNIIFTALSGNHIQGHAGSVIEFSDCVLQLGGETVFTGGQLVIGGDVLITGSGSFAYSSLDSIRIKEFSSLTCQGVMFQCTSEAETPTIIGDSEDATSHFILDNGVLRSEVPVLNLFSLQVISKGNSIVYSMPFDEEGYGIINLGGVQASNNSSLRCSSGSLTLYDVRCRVVHY
jgi:hypothetical protein